MFVKNHKIMSGGRLSNYHEYWTDVIADNIVDVINRNKKERSHYEQWELDENGKPKEQYKYEYDFSDETINEFKNAVKYLKLAYTYATRIDWLISGDDGEETFHECLKEDLRNNGLSKELIDEYNSFIYKTKIYPKELPIIYPVLGMCGESGEAAEKVKKVLRDNNKEFSEENKKAILKELGDVLWYITATAQDMGYSLEDVIKNNFEKIDKRVKTNTQHGEGDNREE